MRKCLCLLLLTAVVVAPCAAEKLTYVDLVNRLIDLEHPAVLPAPGEKCAQWSSYDRASRYDAETGRYVAWDANGDGDGIIRNEGDSRVFAEMEGPGCIWRIWSADPKQGHVRIYLDGSPEPAVDLPFAGYFDLKNEPFVYPSLVHDAASGKNCYVPIPYRKSCKIVADEGWGAYYQFVYTTYPAGTELPTFTRNLSDEEKAALERVDDYLSNRLGRRPPGRRENEIRVGAKAAVSSGQTSIVSKLTGPGAITSIRIKPVATAPEVLRNVILRIYWDGEKTPSVLAPLGDFFGTAPGINEYKSLPLGMTEDGCYCYWYMPFAKQAVVELANESSDPFAAELSITQAQLSRPIAELGRFHAKWHRDAFLPSEPERRIDWTMLKTQGRGRYCGVMLEVWNPRGGWWGEGDEKFFVDGEKFPSTFGTGSEDYFGYAWCNPTLFQNAYHNQTISQGNKGHVSVNRWHITDNIPFHKSFDGAIEKCFANERPTLYACTSYWYLAPGGVDLYQPVPSSERTFYVVPEVYRVKGAVEGEKMRVVEKSSGDVQTQELAARGDNKWSGEAQLWWTNAKPGDRLVLGLPVKDAGLYRLEAQFTKAADYGMFQLYLDDARIGGSIDLYNDGVVPTGEISLGIHDLAAGEHRLAVEIVGANGKASGGKYLFGLDYMKLAAEP